MTVFDQKNYHDCVCAGELSCLCLCRRTIVPVFVHRTIMTVFAQENYRDCVIAGQL